MISISTRSLYGLKALLTLAEHYDQGLLQIKGIAASRNIPHQYLEQIFNLLGKANIIRSFRGKNGGYRLAQPPALITVKEIVQLLEGGIEFVPPGSDPADAVNALLTKAEGALLRAFEVSLAELLTQQSRSRRIPMYDI